MKVYVVATNTDYTILIKANTSQEAIEKAESFYARSYGESRYDWEAYPVEEWLGDDCYEFRNFE